MKKSSAEIKEKYIEDLRSLQDPSDVCDYLIELGYEHPDRQEIRSDKYRIPGCKSLIWCDISRDEDRLDVKMDSDSLLIKGVLKILEDICDGQKADDIKEPLAFLEYIDTSVIYEEIRNNGLNTCYRRMIEIKGD